MHVLCRLGLHQWRGCKCSKCGNNRADGHEWRGCKCLKCGKVRDTEHTWPGLGEGTGCACQVCGKTREGKHNWLVNPEKCHWCGKSREVSPEEKLAFAIENMKADDVAALIATGAWVSPCSLDLMHLSWASDEKALPIVEILIGAGADIESRTYGRSPGWTPLMSASFGCLPKVVQLLLEKGANPDAVDDKGRTAFALAHSHNNDRYNEVLLILSKYSEDGRAWLQRRS